MKKAFCLLILTALVSCNYQSPNFSEKIITVSIAPFKYFVDAIGGNDFSVNVMVPPGSDPHIYEPMPVQITKLRASVGYISNGYLGFEMAWLDRFYESNHNMKKLNLGNFIEPIENEHSHESHHVESHHVESADPHYWVSPKCARDMAVAVRDFLKKINPEGASQYDINCDSLLAKVDELDKRTQEYFEGFSGKPFMIYHPNLAYLARDYGLKEIAVESEGKEPSPSGMRELIDLSRRENISTIFVQREYDTRNARSIAAETGARLVIIDPLDEDWFASTSAIVDSLYNSMKK